MSTTGDVLSHPEIASSVFQVTGDGVKKIQVCVVNDKTVTTPIVGGLYEAVILP